MDFNIFPKAKFVEALEKSPKVRMIVYVIIGAVLTYAVLYSPIILELIKRFA